MIISLFRAAHADSTAAIALPPAPANPIKMCTSSSLECNTSAILCNTRIRLCVGTSFIIISVTASKLFARFMAVWSRCFIESNSLSSFNLVCRNFRMLSANVTDFSSFARCSMYRFSAMELCSSCSAVTVFAISDILCFPESEFGSIFIRATAAAFCHSFFSCASVDGLTTVALVNFSNALDRAITESIAAA